MARDEQQWQGRATLLSGDPSLVRRRVAEIQAAVVGEKPDFGTLEVLHGDQATVEDISTAVRMVSLMGVKLVVLRGADKLREADQKVLAPLIEEIPPQTAFLVTAESPDMRRTLFSTLKKAGQVERLEIGAGRDAAANRRELKQFVETQAKERGAQLSAEAVEALIAYVQSEPARLETEIEKLSLRFGAETVGPRDVLDSVGGERARIAFAMEGALRERRIDRCIGELRRAVAQGERPEMLVGQLAGELRALLRARALLDTGMGEDAAKKAFGGGRGYFVVPRAKNYRRLELERALQRLSRIDVAAKVGLGDVQAELEALLVGLAPRRPQTRPA